MRDSVSRVFWVRLPAGSPHHFSPDRPFPEGRLLLLPPSKDTFPGITSHTSHPPRSHSLSPSIHNFGNEFVHSGLSAERAYRPFKVREKYVTMLANRSTKRCAGPTSDCAVAGHEMYQLGTPDEQDFSDSLLDCLDNLSNLGRIPSGRRSGTASRTAMEWSLHRTGRRPSVAAFSDSVAARRERAPPSLEQEA
jgi:hypothetical protein